MAKQKNYKNPEKHALGVRAESRLPNSKKQ